MKEGAQTNVTYFLRGPEDVKTALPSNINSGNELVFNELKTLSVKALFGWQWVHLLTLEFGCLSYPNDMKSFGGLSVIKISEKNAVISPLFFYSFHLPLFSCLVFL